MTKKWCGPARWKWRPPQFGFSSACKLHDIDYSIPITCTRLEADLRFLREMLDIAYKKYVILFPIRAIIALFFFFLVRVCGERYFDKKMVAQ